MSEAAGVVVVVPARDERDSIRQTLRAIHASVGRARSLGLVRDAVIHVVAHRCVDDTAQRAARFFRRRAVGLVTEEAAATTIGEVRDLGARLGLAILKTAPAESWILSTDADTDVGPGWVASILRKATEHRAVGVVGVARLDRWRGTPGAQVAYHRLLAAKMRNAHGNHEHDHVYGANLAVRADAYLACGGFPHVGLGEDQALVDTLAARGHRLLRTRGIEVTTSGRLGGRARGGLADLLWRLDGPSAPSPGYEVSSRAIADSNVVA